jgi:hypothetical protein
MNPATLEEVRDLTMALYDKIWADWYSNIPGAQKAKVTVSLDDHSAGYNRRTDELLNPIGDGNLEDYDIRDSGGWPIWKIQLVHEMLHEWQYKKPCTPTAAAIALHSKLGRTFIGQGHDADFFEAILEKAPYFNMTPEQLTKRI